MHLLGSDLDLSPTRDLIAGFCATGLLAGVIFATNGLPFRSINRDEAKAFVASYHDFYLHGLNEYHLDGCNFYDLPLSDPRSPAQLTRRGPSLAPLSRSDLVLWPFTSVAAAWQRTAFEGIS